ncbi:MAG: hypothetical protein IPL72_12195 [Sulfuritalea sp.]|nr:hypothetical protein [Sulfuritalea sp.]
MDQKSRKINEPVTVFLKGATKRQPMSAWLRFKSIEADTLWTVACWVFAIVAAVITLCLHRPDADDMVYLGNAVLHLTPRLFQCEL